MTDISGEILQKNKENSDQKENRDISGENLDAEKTLQQTVGKRESNGSARQSGIAPPAELLTVRAPLSAPPTDHLVGAISPKVPEPPYNVPVPNGSARVSSVAPPTNMFQATKDPDTETSYKKTQEDLNIAKEIAGGDTNPLANHLSGVDIAKQELSDALQKLDSQTEKKENSTAREEYRQTQEDLGIAKNIAGGDTNPLTNHLSGVDDAKKESSDALQRLQKSEEEKDNLSAK